MKVPPMTPTVEEPLPALKLDGYELAPMMQQGMLHGRRMRESDLTLVLEALSPEQRERVLRPYVRELWNRVPECPPDEPSETEPIL